MQILLTSGSWDCTVRTWSLEIGANGNAQRKERDNNGRGKGGSMSAGENIMCEMDHDSPVTCVALHPAGSLLASGTQDGTLAVWLLPAGDLVHQISCTYTFSVLDYLAGTSFSCLFSYSFSISTSSSSLFSCLLLSNWVSCGIVFFFFFSVILNVLKLSVNFSLLSYFLLERQISCQDHYIPMNPSCMREILVGRRENEL